MSPAGEGPPLVLIFVEDPGAANFVGPLPAVLTTRGVRPHLLASGTGYVQLGRLGSACDRAGPGDLLAAVDNLGPAVIVLGTSEDPDSPALELVHHARGRGIPTIGVVDGAANAGYRFRGRTDDPVAHAPDVVLVCDQWTRDELVAFGLGTERIVVSGHPHDDVVRAERERLAGLDPSVLRASVFPGIPPDERVVVFLAEVSTGLNPEQYRRSPEYTLDGWGASHGRTEIVLEEFLSAARQKWEGSYLVLRLHPKNELDEFAPYLPLFDLVSREEPALEVVYAADLVVGMTSMLLAEAATLGKRTLSILPRPTERDWLANVRNGSTLVATSRAEIEAAFAQLTGEPEPDIPSPTPPPRSVTGDIADLIVRLATTGPP